MGLIIFLYLIMIIFFIKYNGVRFDYINTCFWLYVVCCCFLGGVSIASGFFDETYFIANSIFSEEKRILGCYILLYSSLLFLFVFFLFSGANKKSWNFYINKNFEINRVDIFFWVLLFLFTNFVSFVYFYQTYPSASLLILNGASGLEIAMRRLELSVNYSEVGSTYIKTSSILFSQLLFISGFLIYLKSRKNFLIYAIYPFFLCFFVLTNTGEKYPLLNLMASIFFVLSYCNFTFNKKYLYLFLFIFFLLFISYYMVSMDLDFSELLGKLFERVFIAQVIILFNVLEIYPNLMPFIGFDSLDILGLKISTRESAAIEVIKIVYYEMTKWGAWNVNGVYIHEAWANFGWLGVMLAPLYVGFVNGILVKIIFSIKKNVISVSVFVFFSVNCLYLITGLNGYIFNLQYLGFILIVMIFYLISYILNRIKI